MKGKELDDEIADRILDITLSLAILGKSREGDLGARAERINKFKKELQDMKAEYPEYFI